VPLDFGTLRETPAEGVEVSPILDSAGGGYVTQAFTDWSNKVRMPMCCHFAFGVPTAAALAQVAEFSDGKLVEVSVARVPNQTTKLIAYHRIRCDAWSVRECSSYIQHLCR
jgi:hypothetical protein